MELALSSFNTSMENPQKVKGITLLALELPELDKETLGKLADKFREKYPDNGVCVVGTVSDGQVVVMATVTQDMIKQGIKAGDLVGYISRQLGAGGGGAPHLAFGGGRDPTKIPAALATAETWLAAKLN